MYKQIKINHLKQLNPDQTVKTQNHSQELRKIPQIMAFLIERTTMQQLVIKLSPEATAQYLAIASAKTQSEMENDMEASGVQLGINMSMIAGLNFTDIDVNGHVITTPNDDEDLQLELVEIN